MTKVVSHADLERVRGECSATAPRFRGFVLQGSIWAGLAIVSIAAWYLTISGFGFGVVLVVPLALVFLIIASLMPIITKLDAAAIPIWDEFFRQFEFYAPNGEAVRYLGQIHEGRIIRVGYQCGYETSYALPMLQDAYGNAHGDEDGTELSPHQRLILRAAESQWTTPVGKTGTVVDAYCSGSQGDQLAIQFRTNVEWHSIATLLETPLDRSKAAA